MCTLAKVCVNVRIVIIFVVHCGVLERWIQLSKQRITVTLLPARPDTLYTVVINV